MLQFGLYIQGYWAYLLTKYTCIHTSKPPRVSLALKRAFQENNVRHEMKIAYTCILVCGVVKITSVSYVQ